MKSYKNILYMLMQGFFWMAYCASYGFMSYFLVNSGFGTSLVGVVSMVSGLASALLQPYVGSLADRAGVGYRKPLRAVLAALILMSAALYAFSAAQLPNAVIVSYGMIMLLLGIGVPLVNTAGIAFPKEVNFGMARATGSLGYAAGSYVLGVLTAAHGKMIIPAAVFAVSVFTFIVSSLMPNAVNEGSGSGKAEQRVKVGFLRRYPQFTLLWINFIFMMTTHCLCNTYLLQILEKAGGDSRSLGIATFLAGIAEMPMIFFYERVNRRFRTEFLFLAAALTYVVRSVLQLSTENLTVLYLIQLLQFTSWAIYAGGSVCYARNSIPAEDRSKAQAYMANALTIGTVIGSLAGGALIEMRGVNTMLVFQTAMAAVCLAGMAVWAARNKKQA